MIPRIRSTSVVRPQIPPRRGAPLALFLALCWTLFGSFPRPAAAAEGTGGIEGRVVPTHDHDFVLGTARLPDLSLRTEVAGDGTFRFERVRPGSYVVEVRVPSLGVALETVEVLAGKVATLEVILKPGSHFEEIFVTAPGEARDPLELASPTTSLSGHELALRSEATLGETLAQEPGISSTFFGPGASRPIIRGLGGDRVRMLEGGLGTGDASGVSADHAVATDPSQAERIEVLRGPATLLYGSSAIGGVVNVLDERIPTSRAAVALSGRIDLRGGSVADENQQAVALDGGHGDWAWHLDALNRQTDDYEVPGAASSDPATREGIVPNSDTETRAGRAGGTFFFGAGSEDRSGLLGISVGGLDSEYGLPSASEADDAVRIDLEQRRVDLKGELTGDLGLFRGVKLRAGATDYQHVELEGEEPGTFFFKDSLEARLELVQKRRGRLTGSVGLQYFERDLEAVGEEAFLPKTSTERWAVFTLQEVSAGPLTWQLGVRYEGQQARPTLEAQSLEALLSRSHDALSTSLGLVWNTGGPLSVAASLARSIKLPAVEELYSNGLHAATQTFEIGDPGLQEEVALGADLGFRLDGPWVSGELTVFGQDFSGFIFQAFTGAEQEGVPVVVYSQRDAEFFGAEGKVRIELFEGAGHHLHLRLVGDVVRARLDAGGDLPRIPPLRLGAGLDYHSETWSGTAEVRWVDEQTRVAANESLTEGYTLVNASVGYRFLLKSRIVDLLLRGRNLTDQEARSHTSFLKALAPHPGRDFSLGVKILF